MHNGAKLNQKMIMYQKFWLKQYPKRRMKHF